MSERKVINKYFPPDFDPAKIPRRRMPKDQQHKVRLMAPFSMRCETCGDYVYKGKKFNARKERVDGEDYLGIMIFRFYIRCPKCSAEITFKTDPKNTDYVCEHGAMRNFEPWRDQDTVNESRTKEREQEEENNPMKALENRTLDSKREMDILDALDEIRTKNAANERMDSAAVLDRLQVGQRTEVERRLKMQEDEDDMLAKAVFQSADDGIFVRRIVDSDEEKLQSGEAPPAGITSSIVAFDALDGPPLNGDSKGSIDVSGWSTTLSSKKKRPASSADAIFARKKVPISSTVATKSSTLAQPVTEKVNSILSLASAYGSDSE